MPTLGVRAARCLEKLGRLVEASERYLKTTALAIDESLPLAFQEAQRTAQAEAAAERAALLPRIATLLITFDRVAPDRLELDGRPLQLASLGVTRAIDPGVHVIVARRGQAEVRREIRLAEGAAEEVQVRFPAAVPSASAAAGAGAPATSAGPPDRNAQSVFRTVGWVGVGVGGVVAGLGLGALGVALSKQGELDRLCPGGVCNADSLSPAGRSAFDTYQVARTLALTGILAGAALAAGGTITLLVTSRSTPQGGKATVRLTPTVFGVVVHGEL